MYRSTRIYVGLIVGCWLASPTIAAANLVVNGGFEDGLNNWQWFGNGVTNVASLSDDTPSGTGSSADLDINEVDGLPWLIQDVPVTAGDELTFSAWVREVEPFRPDVDAWIAAQVWMLSDSQSGQILDYNFALYSNPSWEMQSFPITVPATATIARVLFTPQDPDFGVGTGQYRIDDVSLTIDAPPGVAGDYNDDGTVDAADYVVWRKNENTSNALPNDDGLGVPIEQAHYDLWRENFGNMAAGSGNGLSVGSVPEPATVSLAVLAAMILLSWTLARPEGRWNC